MRATTATLAVFLLVIAAFGAEAWKVEPQGAGAARIGMKQAEVRKALGGQITQEEGEANGCYYLESDQHPLLAFKISHGVLTSVVVTDPGVFTAEGVQVGDTEAQVKKVYGDRVKVEPNPTEKGRHYLTVLTPDGKFGTRFQSDGTKVYSFYAGTTAAVLHFESCM